jgi:translation initiation factor IF-3
MLYSPLLRLRAFYRLPQPFPSTHGRPDRAPWRLLIPPLDKRSAKSFIRTNERIRAREVRVIDENGEQLGVMAPFEALKMARERSLDLVEISPNATPPVCKIQDYGKYLYEKDKSDRAARKKQKVIVIKEVKFSVTVDEHDYQTKKNQAVRFLGEGDKVKASLRFKGRQMAHRDLGYKIINRLIMDIGDAGTVEFMPRMEGTTLHAIIAPTKKAEVQEKPVAAPAPAAPKAPVAAAPKAEAVVPAAAPVEQTVS